MRSVIIFILCACIGTTQSRPPNIVLVVADDYGWNDIGYHGSEIKTPALDKLANQGVKLENYYVQPICTPSRSQLLSGKYQIHTGLQHDVIRPSQPNGLPLELPTLPDKLRKLGYATHMVGKWHLGFYKKEYIPTARGFDSFFGYLTGAEDYFTHTRCESYPSGPGCGYDLHKDTAAASDKYKGRYSAHVFAEQAANIIREHSEINSDKPLFLYLPFQSVHSPLQVPESYIKPYSHIKNEKRRLYAGMVSAMDEAVANVTSVLHDTGFSNNTLFIFTTDNGGQVHSGGNNYPLRGWKGSLWEGGVHGVGFIHGPMIQQKGVKNHQLVHISDWFPTLVSLAGGDVRGLKLDGHNVFKAISAGSESPRKELLHNIDPLHPKHGVARPGSPFDVTTRAALRRGNWKLITGDPGDGHWVGPPSIPMNQSIPRPAEDVEMKLTYMASPQNVWLFDIVADPTEHHDLSNARPDIVNDLLNHLAAYNRTAVTCRYPAYDPQSNPQLHGGVWGPWQI